MAIRPIVSYDDITLPYSTSSPSQAVPAPVPSASKQSQSNKKRKRLKKQHAQQKRFRNATTTPYIMAEYGDEEDDDDEAEDELQGESRGLTHEEIWDDSALIEAWNAATEEYEALNGPDKGWKSEPRHKSPLWYNIPPSQSTSTQPRRAGEVFTSIHAPKRLDDADSMPFNFDTFVPMHDPTLAEQASEQDHFGSLDLHTALASGQTATLDEAFSRAMSAMYWTGYWTAVYHSQRHKDPENEQPARRADSEVQDGHRENYTDEFEYEEEVDEVAETIGPDPPAETITEDGALAEFVSTQR